MNTNSETFNRNTVASLNRANEMLHDAGQIVKAHRDDVRHWRASDELRKSADKLEKARNLLCNAIADLNRELEQMESDE